jgi:signal transduction histidine kinase
MWHSVVARWDNLRIFYKLTAGFLVLVMLMVVQIVVSSLTDDVENRANEKLNQASTDALLAEQLKSLVFQTQNMQNEAILAYVSRGIQNSLTVYMQVEENTGIALDLIQQIKTRSNEPETQALVDALETQMLDYQLQLSDGLVPGIEARGDANSGQLGAVVTQVNQIGQALEAEGYPELKPAVQNISEAVANFLPDSVTAVADIQGISTQVDELIAAVEASDMPADQQQAFIADIRDAGTSIAQFLRNDTLQLGVRVLVLRDLTVAVTDATSDYVDYQIAARDRAQRDHDSAEGFAQRIQLFIALLVVIAALMVSLGISRGITRRVTNLDQITHAIAQGYYNRRTNVVAQDELGRLAQSIDKMTAVIQARESELRLATDKANEATRVKSEFLASISHELRTPLNAIIGFSDMLLMGMSGPLTDKQNHQITRLRENGGRLLNLVNDVLDLSRLEAQRVELLVRPFVLRDLIDRLGRQMAVLAERKNLAFETVIDPALPLELSGDEKRIEQVIVNLISNAVKFTETGSVKLVVKFLPDRSQWAIAVSDTGIGIPPHALDLIFEQFRQLDGSSTRLYQGSGLGLAITRQLVNLMSGQIKVESELGQGSTFTVILPVVEEVERANGQGN